MDLKILHQDTDFVAIDKPAGLLVHRSRVDVSATEFAMKILRDQLGQLVYPVHRIDRPTSGVLLFALSKDITRNLGAQFQNGKVSKTYSAIVRGHPPDAGATDEPLKERHDKMTDGKANKDKPAQQARTEFTTQSRWTMPFATNKYSTSRYALVSVTPFTGRKHQIRRHFNHMAWPILGDTTHGDRRHNRLFREHFDCHRLLLVARTLSFDHPKTGNRICVRAELGSEFEDVMEKLNVGDVSLS